MHLSSNSCRNSLLPKHHPRRNHQRSRPRHRQSRHTHLTRARRHIPKNFVTTNGHEPVGEALESVWEKYLSRRDEGEARWLRRLLRRNTNQAKWVIHFPFRKSLKLLGRFFG